MSLLLAGLSVPFVRIVAGQIGEMVPNIGRYMWNDPVRAAVHSILSDRQIYTIRLACQRASDLTDRLDLGRFRQEDPNNGIYDYLEVLGALRQPNPDESVLRNRIRSLKLAPKGKLYLTRQYRLAREVFEKAKLSPRRAARAAEEIRPLFPYLQAPQLRETHGPLLCELTRRLLEQGNAWQKLGQPKDAVAAHSAVVNLWIDLAEESPTPDIMLLATELLPSALHELARDVDAIGADQPKTVEGYTLKQQAERIASLHARWHELADRDGMNVLPFTGGSFHILLAPRQHQNVMCSLCVSLLFMAIWLILLVLCLFFLAIAIVTYGPVDTTLAWRSGSHGKMWATVIVCAPVILWAIAIWAGWLDFAWLISLPTLSSLFVLPAMIPVMIGLSVRLQMARTTSLAWSRAGTWIAIAVLGLTIVLGPILFATHSQTWLPPKSTQVFRSVASFLGLESVVILILWMAMAFVRLVRGKFSGRSWSHIYLHVSSSALLAFAVLLLPLLMANHRLDIAHSQAFAKAAANPCSNRLGEAWHEAYFAGARELAKQIATIPKP